MKTRVYLRVAKKKSGKTKVTVSTRALHGALEEGNYLKTPLPTVLIALDLTIPDKEFDAARIQLEANIAKTTPAVQVKQVVDDE